MKESIYLGGWEVDFQDNEELRNFIIQHKLSKNDFEIFMEIRSGLEIIIEDGKIVEVLNQPGNEKVSGPIDFIIPNSKVNKLFWLKASNNGIHTLGGMPPENLKILVDETFKPVYIGSIDCSDLYFNWIGLGKFHIFYPLNFYSESVYVDYSNEDRPTIINQRTKEEFKWKVFLDKVKYESTKSLNYEDLESYSSGIHQCGVPLWCQYPELPKCPKTGDLMNFVCSISSDKNIHILEKGFWGVKKTEKFLMFGDMGTLYVFYNPKSKIAYKTIQF